MSSSREKILANIRSGLQGALLPEAAPEKPELEFPNMDGTLSFFVAELEKLSCEVHQTNTHQEAMEIVIQLFRDRHWKKTLIWQSLLDRTPYLKQSLENAEIEIVPEGDLDDLARIPVGITDVGAAIADTGTLVLQNLIGQPSFVSLLPDIHIAVVDSQNLYPNLPAYLDSIHNPKETLSASNNLVFITGPSRTGDIELSLTLGVHGPRELIVIIINGS
jgi:L-lactate dehydrogenase complex protein LldG